MNANSYCWMARTSDAPKFFVPREAVEVSENILRRRAPGIYESDKLDSVLGVHIGKTGKRIELGPITYVERITRARKKPLPIMQIGGTVWAVDETFRAIVEQFEPGVHQFIQMEVRGADGLPSGIPYYVFNVCQRITGVDLERSNVCWNTRADGSKFASVPSYNDQILVHGSAVVGKHIWRDDYFFWEAVFCSDAIRRAFRAAKLNMLEFVRTRLDVAP
jgi:hypothetical protein